MGVCKSKWNVQWNTSGTDSIDNMTVFSEFSLSLHWWERASTISNSAHHMQVINSSSVNGQSCVKWVSTRSRLFIFNWEYKKCPLYWIIWHLLFRSWSAELNWRRVGFFLNVMVDVHYWGVSTKQGSTESLHQKQVSSIECFWSL